MVPKRHSRTGVQLFYNPKIALCDITEMYPNVDVEEAIEIIGDKYEEKPSEYNLPKDCVVEGLKLCQECNCVQFNDRYYLPCRGCAMGPSHGCDLTDLWLGPITD